MAAFNFYDDKYGFEPSTTSSSEVVQKVHTWLGLWCHVRPQRYAAEDQAIAESGAGRRDLFHPGASSFPTRSGGEASRQAHVRRVAALGQDWEGFPAIPLRTSIYLKMNHSKLNKALVLSLKQWLWLISEGPPRPIEFTKPRVPDFVVVTDGSVPDGSEGFPNVFFFKKELSLCSSEPP